MGSWFDAKRRLRSALMPALLGCVVVYFGYHTVQGENGLIAYARKDAMTKRAEIELAELVTERRRLERRANQLRPESLDPDMLDERARWMLGLAHPDEVIIVPDAPR
jgi:cell division protein FtsB